VTWQITNGTAFLGLTDLSAYGLQRGVLYLLDHEFQEWLTDEPLFELRPAGLWARFQRLFGRNPEL
jgi:hypothetical protein